MIVNRIDKSRLSWYLSLIKGADLHDDQNIPMLYPGAKAAIPSGNARVLTIFEHRGHGLSLVREHHGRSAAATQHSGANSLPERPRPVQVITLLALINARQLYLPAYVDVIIVLCCFRTRIRTTGGSPRVLCWITNATCKGTEMAKKVSCNDLEFRNADALRRW